MATDPNQEVNEQVAAIVGGVLEELRSQFVTPPPAPVFPPPVPPPSVALPNIPGAPPIALPVNPQTGPKPLSNLGRPSKEERRQQQRDRMLLEDLYKSAGYQRTYETPTEEWTPEDLSAAGEVQATRLELESRVGMYRPLADENAIEAEIVLPELPIGRRERNETNPAKAAYYASQAQPRRQREKERRAVQDRNRLDAELRNRAGTPEWFEDIEIGIFNDAGKNWQSGLEQAAEMERNAPPSPRQLAAEAAPPDRNFFQRARQAAVDAGFINRPNVPEAFQTDEWKQANAPLSEQERWKFGLDMAAVAGFGYLGRQAAGGVTSFVTDEGTGRVLNDVTGTATGGLQNVATGAAAGMQLGGPAGAAVGAVVGAGATIATLPQKILDWSQALVDSRERLSMWSGQLQAMRREAEIRGYARDIESARNTAGTASSLNSSLQGLYDELRPMKDQLYNLVAGVASIFVEMLKIGVQINNAIVGTGQAIMDAIPTPEWQKELRDKMKESIDADKLSTVQKWAVAWRDTRIPSARVPRR